jgi:DNA invertase Pin-like site-specific DNA recombinase
MAIAYSYTRFSTPDQVKGDSYERQRLLAEAYAREKGLTLDTTYKDSGVSARSGKHVAKGALGRFVKAVTGGTISEGSYLLLEQFDRFSREDVLIALDLFRKLLDAGIIIVTLNDRQEFTRESVKSTQLVMVVLRMQAAYEYSENLAGRLKSAWSSKRQAVAKKKMTKWAPAWLETSEDRESHTIIEERADVVRRIFDLYIAGNGAHLIVRTLNSEGVPTFEGKGKRKQATGWHHGYIARIVNNRAVIGEFEPKIATEEKNRDGKLVRRDKRTHSVTPDYYPAIIDRAVWDRAAIVKAMRHGTGGRKQNVVTVFGGLMCCNVCGGGIEMRSKAYGGRTGEGYDSWFRGIYVACSNASRKVRCKETGEPLCTVTGQMKYGVFEETILNTLENVLLGPEHVRQNGLEDLEAEIGRLSDDIARDKEGIVKAMARFGTDPLMEEAIETLRESVQTKLNDLDALKQILSQRRGSLPPRDGAEKLKALREAARSDDPEVRRKARLEIADAMPEMVERVYFNIEGKVAYLRYGGIMTAIITTSGDAIHVKPRLADDADDSDLAKMRRLFQRATVTEYVDENGEKWVNLAI